MMLWERSMQDNPDFSLGITETIINFVVPIWGRKEKRSKTFTKSLSLDQLGECKQIGNSKNSGVKCC